MSFFSFSWRRVPVVKALRGTTPALPTWVMVRAFPCIIGVLAIIFICCGYVAKDTLEGTSSRNAQLQVQALCREIEHAIDDARNQILFLSAASRITADDLLIRFSYRTRVKPGQFRELAFIGRDPENRVVLLNVNGKVVILPRPVAESAVNQPFAELPDIRTEGEVSVGRPVQTTYTMVPVGDAVQNVSYSVLRFYTPVYDYNNNFQGMLLLSLDLTILRDALTLFSSSSSPMYDNQSDFKHVRSVFVDTAGWMLFQSETPDIKGAPLSTEALRSGLNGDSGRPGLLAAFRPAPQHTYYWDVISEINASKSGQMALGKGVTWGGGQNMADFLSYAPVTYTTGSETAHVLGGVITLDTSYAAEQNISMLYAVFSVCTFLGGVSLIMLTYWGACTIRGYLHLMLGHIQEQNATNGTVALPLWRMPEEFCQLSESIGNVFLRLREAAAHKSASEEKRTDRWLQELVPNIPQAAEFPATGLVGESSAMAELRLQIEKAAPIFADVLVIGETGTGKELVSAALHSVSERDKGPFISINCGALDENLLMDSLFGHVKGAFSDAHTERKGAFIAAEGGTLMLDEIGNATTKVQQALLRALSTRQICPLGSDKEVPFNTRIVAATNIDLREEVKQGRFREDLYYRLAVFTIHTCPLRERKEDIEALTNYFLSQAAEEMRRPCTGLTRGALQKMQKYDWPGNVRQLRNTLTRALAYSNDGIIRAPDIVFTDGVAAAVEKTSPTEEIQGKGTYHYDLLFTEVNSRQRVLLPVLFAKGSITRSEYQALLADTISTRTAQYDLQELVQRGLLRKKGVGPASYYELIPHDDSNDIKK